MIHYLLITVLVLTFFAYIRKRQYIFSPSVLACISFDIAVFFAMLNIQTWNINLSLETCLVIAIGLLVFVISDSSRVPTSKSFVNLPLSINPPAYKTIIVLIISIAFTYLYYSEVTRIAYTMGGMWDSSEEMMQSFRSSTMFSEDADAKINQYVVWGATFVNSAAHIYLFIFIYNAIAKVRITKNLLNLLPVSIYVVQALMSGGRGSLLGSIMIALFFIFILNNAIRKKVFRLRTKDILRIFFAMVAGLYGFYAVRLIVGRLGSEDVTMFDYLSEYIGAPIQLLDMYLKQPSTTAQYWGEETFSGIYSLFAKVFHFYYSPNLEFRFSSSGYRLGNVYTAFRRFYNDFEWSGVVIMPFIMATIYSWANNRLVYKRYFSFDKKILGLIIYGFFLRPLIMMGQEEFFFLEIFRVGFLIKVFMIYIIYRYVIKNNLVYERSRNATNRINSQVSI